MSAVPLLAVTLGMLLAQIAVAALPSYAKMSKEIDAVVASKDKLLGAVWDLTGDGKFAAKPDVAIVVFGETPYAEFTGDRPSLEYSPEDKSDLALLTSLKAAGVPTVAVFLSGRPMWVNPELNAADAFVASS